MKRISKVLLGVLLAVTIPASSAAQGRPCLRVEAPAPVVLPDASAHEAGSLRICYEREFSPVWSLHTIYIEGAPIGMFRAKRIASGKEPGSSPYVAFRRADDGTLILVGYGWPGSERVSAYRLDPVPVVRVRVQTAKNDGASAPTVEKEDESRLLLIAAAD